MNASGKLIFVFDTQVVKETFKKREFVIEMFGDTQYPQEVKFEVVQDKCDMLEQYNLGDQMDIEYNMQGRSWVNAQGVKNWFNTLQAWKVKGTGTAQPNNAANNNTAATNQQATSTTNQSKQSSGGPGSHPGNQADDDMPF